MCPGPGLNHVLLHQVNDDVQAPGEEHEQRYVTVRLLGQWLHHHYNNIH